MKSTRDLTLGAVFTALSIIMLFAASILPTMRLALLFLASFMPCALVVECKSKLYAFCSGVATTFLSFLLIRPQGIILIGLILYALLFSYYPVLKSVLENKCTRIIEWIIKETVFTAVSIILYFIAKNIGIDIFNAVIFIAAFTIYDILLSFVISMYITRISHIVRREK